MPLLTPAVSSELRWSKTESGTVLSSFFWGYTVTQVRTVNFRKNLNPQVSERFLLFWTKLKFGLPLFYHKFLTYKMIINIYSSISQVLGGYFSDRIGGQRVIFVAAIGWSLITFWMPDLLAMTSRQSHYNIPFIVTIRILNGALQGVHFPSMISITSQVQWTKMKKINFLFKIRWIFYQMDARLYIISMIFLSFFSI